MFDQPRDDKGQFASEGGGGLKAFSEKHAPKMSGEGFAALLAKSKARVEAIKTFASTHAEKPFSADLGKGRSVLVTKDPTTKQWRTTMMDRKGPSGHYFHASYHEAVGAAVKDHGAELNKAVF